MAFAITAKAITAAVIAITAAVIAFATAEKSEINAFTRETYGVWAKSTRTMVRLWKEYVG